MPRSLRCGDQLVCDCACASARFACFARRPPAMQVRFPPYPTPVSSSKTVAADSSRRRQNMAGLYVPAGSRERRCWRTTSATSPRQRNGGLPSLRAVQQLNRMDISKPHGSLRWKSPPVPKLAAVRGAWLGRESCSMDAAANERS